MPKPLEPEQAIWELLFDLQNDKLDEFYTLKDFIAVFKKKISHFWGENAWDELLIHYGAHVNQLRGEN